jgi:hypothetical protein
MYCIDDNVLDINNKKSHGYEPYPTKINNQKQVKKTEQHRFEIILYNLVTAGRV